MIHLVSENFQTMLFLFFFSLPFKLPCLPLLPSPLQHIWPKLHPKGNTKGADIRREQPPLRHRHDQHYLSFLPQYASRLWGGVYGAPLLSCVSISFSAPHPQESTPLSGINASFCECLLFHIIIIIIHIFWHHHIYIVFQCVPALHGRYVTFPMCEVFKPKSFWWLHISIRWKYTRCLVGSCSNNFSPKFGIFGNFRICPIISN